jgi:hypothetical protein
VAKVFTVLAEDKTELRWPRAHIHAMGKGRDVNPTTLTLRDFVETPKGWSRVVSITETEADDG